MAQDFAHLGKAVLGGESRTGRGKRRGGAVGKIPALRGVLLQCMVPLSK
jgi:hypothetical protein